MVNNSKKHFDLAIVGIPTVANYGGTLTYIALCELVKSLGYSVCFVERPLSAKHKPSSYQEFYHKAPLQDVPIFATFANRRAMEEMNNYTETFLVGSDQLFHPFLIDNFDRFALLDWAYDYKKKIAFGASFGHDKFNAPNVVVAETGYYLNKFDAFATREYSGKIIAEETFNMKNVEEFVDPVFLCDRNVYFELAKNAIAKYEKGYVSSYILDMDAKRLALLKKLSAEMGLSYHIYTEHIVSKNFAVKNWGCEIEVGKAEDRLYSMINSDFVVADSFHGICFAIIFEKNFVAYVNKRRGPARFINILSKLGLMHKLIDVDEPNINIKDLLQPIDYKIVNKKLEAEKSRAIDWLRNILKKPITKSMSDMDIIRRKNSATIEYAVNYLKRKNYVTYRFENNLCSYLNILAKNSRRLAIFIAVRDTAGMFVTETMNKAFNSIGLNTNMRDIHWCGFIGVIYQGNILHEACRYETALEKSATIEKLNFSLISKPLNQGNSSSIKINGVEYSMNMRGFNIVVAETDSGIITDSVNFDTHSHNAPCKHCLNDKLFN